MITTIQLEHAIYIKNRQFVFFYIPKVACTNWKAILRFINDGSEDYLNPQIAHNRKTSGLHFLSEDNNSLSILLNKNIKKYTVIRNPYTRVLSAFLNKFSDKVCQEEPYFNNIKNEVLLHKINNHIDATYKNVTFYSFLHWLKFSGSLQATNEHWQLQTKIIGDDLSLFDFIGRFEHLKEDAQIILNEIDFLKPFPTQQEIKFKPTDATKKMNHYFSEREIKLTCQIYKKDFEILGYSTKMEKYAC